MLTHPAVAVAQERVAGLDAEFGVDFTPAAIQTIGDNAAAVVMDSSTARFIVIAEDKGDGWTAPAMTIGSPRPDGPRAARTPDDRPLNRMSRKRSATLDDERQWPEHVWYAVTGLAAEDATEISIVVDGREHREPIAEDGLAFVVARIQRDHEPEVYVHTQDGRRVIARH